MATMSTPAFVPTPPFSTWRVAIAVILPISFVSGFLVAAFG